MLAVGSCLMIRVQVSNRAFARWLLGCSEKGKPVEEGPRAELKGKGMAAGGELGTRARRLRVLRAVCCSSCCRVSSA